MVKAFPLELEAMPTFATSTQHNTESYSHSNEARQRNKQHPNCKGGSKVSSFHRYYDLLYKTLNDLVLFLSG